MADVQDTLCSKISQTGMIVDLEKTYDGVLTKCFLMQLKEKNMTNPFLQLTRKKKKKSGDTGGQEFKSAISLSQKPVSSIVEFSYFVMDI